MYLLVATFPSGADQRSTAEDEAVASFGTGGGCSGGRGTVQ